jgi:hypothetical protein
MAISKLLQTILVLSLIPVGAYAVTTASQSSHTPASLGLSSLSIAADGNGTVIGNMDGVDGARPGELSLPVSIPIGSSPEMRPPNGEMSTASVSISATVVQKNGSAVIAYKVSGSSLTIGGTTYQIVNGTGIFNQHSLVVVLHATVQSGDWTGVLILHGHAKQALSDPGTISVDFDTPQSKLAAKFSLELEGTLTLS